MSDRSTIKGHTIVRTIRIEAPRARVWAALTEPALIDEWFGDATRLSALEVGGTGQFDWEDYGSFPMEITEIEPMDVFAYRWSGIPAEELAEGAQTLVTFTLADDGAGTQLTVVESGFEHLTGGTVYRRARLDQNREGWDIELDELAGYLEG